MTLAQIQQIVTVAEEKSIGKAAAKLYMNQPNLSQSISKLEKELNLRIFQRTSSGVILTDEGFYCLKLCREILERTEELQNYANIVNPPVSDSNRKVIHISVAAHSYEFFMNAVSAYAKKKLPRKLDLDLKEVSGNAGFDLVEKEKVDFALTTVYPYTRERKESQIADRNLNFEVLGNRISGIYISADNRDFDNDKYVDFNKLAVLPFFMANSGELVYSEFVSYLKKKGVEFNCERISRASTWLYIVRAINVQNGFALGTESTDTNPINPLVRFIPFDPEIVGSSQIICVTKNDRNLNSNVKELIHFIKNELI